MFSKHMKQWAKFFIQIPLPPSYRMHPYALVYYAPPLVGPTGANSKPPLTPNLKEHILKVPNQWDLFAYMTLRHPTKSKS